MVTWFFENNQFTNAWIPFDRINQMKLEYVYRHHEQILSHVLEYKKTTKSSNPLLPSHTTINDIDPEEEDPSIHPFIQYSDNCISINLNDSHFEHSITLYPLLLLGSLPDRDILIIRAEMMDHKNKYLLVDD